MPLGYLIPPVFNHSRSSASDFGAIGFIVGHELFHNIHFATRATFIDKSKCFVKQYSSIVEPRTGLRLNGTLTLAEDVADNGAIKAAFAAYQKLNYFNRTVQDYRTFFYSFARHFCERHNDAELESGIQTDIHTLFKYRVNTVLQNFDAFSKTFNCKPKTPMNPLNKCAVW